MIPPFRATESGELEEKKSKNAPGARDRMTTKDEKKKKKQEDMKVKEHKKKEQRK